MVGHDHGNVQVKSDVMIVKAALQHDGTSPARQETAILSAEGYEMRLAITLEVRENTAVEVAMHG
jgi:hypothetical protein